ncbi:hypothetical protein Tco_0200889 [Tanacetum coccineum]
MSQSTKPLLTADQLVHVNRQYEVAKANKKVDLTKLPCSAGSKIIGGFYSVIHLTFSVNDLRIVLKLPQATDNDHAEFVEAPELAEQLDIDNMTETQQLSYTVAKSDKEAKAQENVKLVEQHLLDKDVNKIVKGDDSTDVEFVASVLLSQKDSGTRIDLGSDTERPKVMNLDYVAIVKEEEESAEAAWIQKKGKSIPPQSSSKHSRNFQGALERISRRHGHMLQNMRHSFVQKSNIKGLGKQIDKSLETNVPHLVSKTTNQIFNDTLPGIVQEAVQKEHACTKSGFSSSLISDVQLQLYLKMKNNPQPPEASRKRDHDDHSDDPPEGEKGSKRQKTTKGSSSLGIKSYHIKVNLIAPTITFPDTKTLPLYSIIADRFVGIIYENSKKEKRDVNIDELQKFCDAT